MIFCLGNWKSVEGERMEITDGIGLAKFGEIGKLLLIVVLVKFILYGCLTFRNGCIEKIARYQTVVAVFVGNGLDGTALFNSNGPVYRIDSFVGAVPSSV